jgi:hypothetical protein
MQGPQLELNLKQFGTHLGMYLADTVVAGDERE